MAAVPGKTGVMPVPAAGMEVGVVDVTVSVRPVIWTPLMSVTTAVIGSVLFGFTVTALLTVFGVEMVMVFGGHTEMRPAVEVDCAMVAVTTVVPGASAVATPLVFSKVTRPAVCAVKVACPAV